MTAVKRDYCTGSDKKDKFYSATMSKKQFDLLEDLRKEVSRNKGRDISRGQFVMWMYYRIKTMMTKEEIVAIDDFCDKQNSSINQIFDILSNMVDNSNNIKRKFMEIDSEEDGDGESEEDC